LEVPTQWNSDIMVKDLDASTVKAEALGATTCIPAPEIPCKGRFASPADPQGSVIAFWEFA